MGRCEPRILGQQQTPLFQGLLILAQSRQAKRLQEAGREAIRRLLQGLTDPVQGRGELALGRVELGQTITDLRGSGMSGQGPDVLGLGRPRLSPFEESQTPTQGDVDLERAPFLGQGQSGNCLFQMAQGLQRASQVIVQGGGGPLLGSRLQGLLQQATGLPIPATTAKQASQVLQGPPVRRFPIQTSPVALGSLDLPVGGLLDPPEVVVGLGPLRVQFQADGQGLPGLVEAA